MGTGRDTAADRLQVMLHGVGIGARKHERGAGVARGADRAEHIGVGVTLILGLARPRPLLCPLIDQAVLLPDPHFILGTRPRPALPPPTPLPAIASATPLKSVM